VGIIIRNCHFYIVLMGTLDFSVREGACGADIVVISKILNSIIDGFSGRTSKGMIHQILN